MELTLKQALQQGVAAHRDGKLEKAERLYRAILQSHPTHPDANHNLGVLAVSLNKTNLAIPLFETALEANPNIEQYWLSYIGALIKQQRFENASQVIERSKERGFDEKKLNSLSAMLLQPSRQNEDKLDSKSVHKKPSKNKKKFEKGKIETSKKSLSGKKPPPHILSRLEKLYEDGEYGDTEELALSLTSEFPNHPMAWKFLGAVLAVTGRKSEAINVNKTAVELSPRDATVHFNLGAMLDATGRLDQAVISFKRATTLVPDFSEAHKRLGKTLLKLGHHQEGLKERRIGEGVITFDLQHGLGIT